MVFVDILFSRFYYNLKKKKFIYYDSLKIKFTMLKIIQILAFLLVLPSQVFAITEQNFRKCVHSCPLLGANSFSDPCMINPLCGTYLTNFVLFYIQQNDKIEQIY